MGQARKCIGKVENVFKNIELNRDVKSFGVLPVAVNKKKKICQPSGFPFSTAPPSVLGQTDSKYNRQEIFFFLPRPAFSTPFHIHTRILYSMFKYFIFNQ